MKHKLIIISSLAIVLASCSTVQQNNRPNNPGRRNGPTANVRDYLHGMYRPRQIANQSMRNDPVSYWDGDGVSGSPKIKIDLSDQKAYFYKGSQLVGVSRISSGKEGYNTPTGSFKVTQKSKDHRSNLYGELVDAQGNVINKDADSRKDFPPPGGKFLGAPMPYFMRFNGGVGLHAGFIPGYAASHGCVRMPEPMAQKFFQNVKYGTPVQVVR